MKHICIISHAHLCRNPRVVKEATILSAAGYKVTIMTVWTNKNLLAEDKTLVDTKLIRYMPTVSIYKEQANRLSRFTNRIIKKVAGMLVKYFHIETVYAIGYGYGSMLKKAKLQKADLYICHQELPTVVGCKLIKTGFKVAFDFEDWYSHDLLPEDNRSRPVKLLKKYEQFALQHGIVNYTTSSVLSEHLMTFAGSKKPDVILNAFPFSDRKEMDKKYKDRVRNNRVSLFWFSQTIGPGRGLEELADALNHIGQPFELHLRGNSMPGYESELKNRFELKPDQDIYFHTLVPHKELLSRIAEHDIGLALEKKNPSSRNLTITNKILQYLLGGLAVIATDTLGQQEVAASAPESVFTFQGSSTSGLQDRISFLVKNKKALETAKTNAIVYAEQKYSTEKEADKLVKLISELR